MPFVSPPETCCVPPALGTVARGFGIVLHKCHIFPAWPVRSCQESDLRGKLSPFFFGKWRQKHSLIRKIKTRCYEKKWEVTVKHYALTQICLYDLDSVFVFYRLVHSVFPLMFMSSNMLPFFSLNLQSKNRAQALEVLLLDKLDRTGSR